MTEQNQTILDFFTDLFRKVQISLSRPDVQRQVMIIAAVVLLAWVGTLLLNFVVTRWIAPRIEAFAADDNSPKRVAKRLIPGLRLLIYPVLAILLTNMAIATILGRGQVVGLLRLLAFILWVLFMYRLVFAVLYLFFPEPRVSGFQSRLFGPLFSLFVGYYVLSLFVNIPASANIVLANFSESPVTIGALFLATVGLYFWFNGIWGVNNIILGAAHRFTNINTGRLEAALALIGYILIAVGIVMALSALGVSATTFAAITAGLSVGVGFALKEVLGNFISGLLLLFEGSIRPGDQIVIDGSRGTITKLKVSSTHVKLRDSKEVIVPNQTLLADTVTTYTGSDSLLRLDLQVRTDYRKSPTEILELLMEIAESCPHILPDKKPKVLLLNIDEMGMDFRIRVFIDIDTTGPGTVYNDIYLKIWDAFEKHGISFPEREGVPYGAR